MRLTECEDWKKGDTGDKGKQHLQERDGGTDSQKLPYVFRSVRILVPSITLTHCDWCHLSQLREDFINALATEAQKIVDEIATLGEERRYLQQCVRPHFGR